MGLSKWYCFLLSWLQISSSESGAEESFWQSGDGRGTPEASSQVDHPEGSMDTGMPCSLKGNPQHQCSFVAFHGTSSENLHSILRCGEG